MRKSIALLLSVFLLMGLCACGNGADTPTPGGTRVITDGLGREIEVPETVERIVTLGNATRMAVYLGLTDRLVSVASGDLSESLFMAYGVYNREAWAELPVVSSGGYGEVNPEAILAAEPDVILCTYEEDIVANIESQLGRQVVAAPQGTLFGEDYELALRVFGDACGVSERAEEVISFIHNCLDDLDGRTRDIPDENKPLVLTAAATFRGGHGISGIYASSAVLAAVNARDAAEGISDAPKGVEVDREQILAWDPDIIILDAGNVSLVRAEYAEDPDFFSQLKAVQNGRVYQAPNSTANYTNVEIPLVSAYYAGTLLCPEAFADLDFEAKAEEIFSFFLGHEGYLELLSENGLGYGSVTFEK